MSKFKVSNKSSPISPPATREQFAESAAMVQAQTGGRPLKPIRVNFDMDPTIHRQLKLLALDKNLTVAQFLRDLIYAELAR